MNTSAFVTSIRIKIKENQYSTFLLIFAFCLFIASMTLEKIIGNLLVERLEEDRKKEFTHGIQVSFEERWKIHTNQIRSYAYWPEVWDLIKAKKNDKAYLNFQLDPSIDKQFDFFGIYLNDQKEFIIRWSEGSGEKRPPDFKTISHFYTTQSHREGFTNYIIYFNQKYYLTTVTCLADNNGKPMIDGIMVFSYRFDKIISSITALFPIQIEILEGEDVPQQAYSSVSLDKLTLPGSKKLTLIFKPDISRAVLIRPYIISLLAILSVISFSIYAWAIHKIRHADYD
ncbi:MAG TPA: hypothetical protein PK079_08420 [Leptospiraceae bacterium]|nr:hypothetical protein [Leptospiraceae bacterium]HMW04378.1 hypothetical protein [Leptospiraceae bacterium]HNA06317.1 hypothetical protein [Leptospiraceae bacterium]HNB97372.1 hypothetical protein [Leptospiraceae bacterium]HNE07059.1 hypothetical protein [Leptospiraceae bacterium]